MLCVLFRSNLHWHLLKFDTNLGQGTKTCTRNQWEIIIHCWIWGFKCSHYNSIKPLQVQSQSGEVLENTETEGKLGNPGFQLPCQLQHHHPASPPHPLAVFSQHRTHTHTWIHSFKGFNAPGSSSSGVASELGAVHKEITDVRTS